VFLSQNAAYDAIFAIADCDHEAQVLAHIGLVRADLMAAVTPLVRDLAVVAAAHSAERGLT